MESVDDGLERLLLLAAPAAAQAVTADEFAAMAEGRTLRFSLDGAAFGAEQYFAGHRSLWRFEDGGCLRGRWWADNGLICFSYEDDPAAQCWRFAETADALIEHRKRQEFRVQQEALVNSLRDAARLSNIRYRGGVTSYLEVLDTERQLFDAEIGLAQAQRDELVAVVRLYRALGGGWQT